MNELRKTIYSHRKLKRYLQMFESAGNDIKTSTINAQTGKSDAIYFHIKDNADSNEIDALYGGVLLVKKPWYRFLF